MQIIPFGMSNTANDTIPDRTNIGPIIRIKGSLHAVEKSAKTRFDINSIIPFISFSFRVLVLIWENSILILSSNSVIRVTELPIT